MHRLLPRMIALLLLLAAAAPLRAADALPPSVEEVRTLLEAGDLERATEAADRAVATLAGDARAWFWAGRAYGLQALRASLLMRARWAGRTRDALERAVELDPAYLDARLDLMNYYQQAPGFMGGGADKARAQATAIGAQHPSLGRYAEASLVAADDPARAEALLREALALDPGNVRARTALNHVFAQRKDWAAARRLWEEVLAHPQLAFIARYQLGRLAALSGEQLTAALAHLDAFIADGGTHDGLTVGAAHWRRAHVLEKLGRNEEAIAALRQVKDDPNIGEQARKDLARLAPED